MLMHTTEKRVVQIPLRPKDIVWGKGEVANSSIRK